MENTIYIRLRHRTQVPENAKVYLKDIAVIIAPEEKMKLLENLLIYQVSRADKNMIVIDGMTVISEVKKLTPDCEIELIGPMQSIVEVFFRKNKLSTPVFLVVWFLLFIGSGITIMNFHEDVSMQIVHQKLFYLMTGIEDSKPLIFQIPYSLGLGLGMILFFNHVFKKRINEEPSPLEVEMFNYQQAIDQYIAMNENKVNTKRIDDD